MRLAAAYRLACVFLCTLAIGGEARGGAFVQREGEGALFVTGYVTTGDRFFDSDGHRQSRGRFTKRELQAFVEYGLTGRVTAFAALPFQKITMKNPSGSREGLGRSEAGLRVKLWEAGGWIVSAQGSALIGGAKRRDGLAAIGEMDGGVDGRALVAYSFEVFGKPAFIDLQAGYRTRSGDPSDEIRADATAGLRLTPKLLVMAQSLNQISVKQWAGPIPLKQRLHKLQGVIYYDLTETLSLFGAAFFMPWGRDALDERGGTIGVGYKF